MVVSVEALVEVADVVALEALRSLIKKSDLVPFPLIKKSDLVPFPFLRHLKKSDLVPFPFLRHLKKSDLAPFLLESGFKKEFLRKSSLAPCKFWTFSKNWLEKL